MYERGTMMAGLEAEDAAAAFNINIKKEWRLIYEYDSKGIGTNELCESPANRGDGRRLVLSPFV
jgi:hypothetical protein